MPDTETQFSEATIAAYLGDAEVSEDHTTGSILTAVRIIARHEPDSTDRNVALVADAFQNILEWAGDYGISVERTGSGEYLIDVQ